MRKINEEIENIMQSAVGGEYAKYILESKDEDEEYNYIGNTFAEDVIEDVMRASAGGHYNDDDIRLAIGRVLIDRLRLGTFMKYNDRMLLNFWR